MLGAAPFINGMGPWDMVEFAVSEYWMIIAALIAIALLAIWPPRN